MRALTIITLGLATLGIASPYKGGNQGQSHEVDQCDESNDNGHDGAGSYGEGQGHDDNGHDDDGQDDGGHDDDGHDDDGHGDDGHGDDGHGSDGHGSDGHGDEGHGDDGHGKGHCITRVEAHHLAKGYAALVGAFKESDAHYWLADDFLDYSDSINVFKGNTLGTPTFNKAGFIEAQSNTANSPTPMTVIGEPVVDCDRVAILWSSTFGKGWVARGLTIVEVRENDKYKGGEGDVKGDRKGEGRWKMTRWDVEFNALAWAYNMGQYFCLFGHATGDASVCAAAPKARGLEWEG